MKFIVVVVEWSFFDFSPITRDLINYGLKFDYKIHNKRE